MVAKSSRATIDCTQYGEIECIVRLYCGGQESQGHNRQHTVRGDRVHSPSLSSDATKRYLKVVALAILDNSNKITIYEK